MSSAAPEALAAPFADAIARVCQIYGIPPKYGQLYAHLFMSAEPLSLADLAERAGAAKSTVSVVMRKLERYRFVRRRPRGSDRRDWYEPVVDPMQVLQDWVRLFIAPEIAVGGEMVRQLERSLEAEEVRAALDDEAHDTLLERAAVLRRAVGQGQQFIAMLSALEGATTAEANHPGEDP